MGGMVKLLIVGILAIGASAESLRFSVERHMVAEPVGDTTRVEQVVFLDRDPLFRVFFPVGVATSLTDVDEWKTVLSFEICRDDGGETVDCTEPAITPIGFGRVSGDLQFSGKLMLEETGVFSLRAYLTDSDATGSTKLKVLRGDESEHVRDAWLRTHAEAATSWEDYKSYQLSRTELFPDRITPYQQLAFMGARIAPEHEAREMIDLLLARLEEERTRLVTIDRRQWLDDEIANFRWLRTQLQRLRTDRNVVLSWERGARRNLAIVEVGTRKVVEKAPLPRRIGQ